MNCPEACHLCGIHSSLQASHVVPAFPYRYLRNSSATGYMRDISNINERQQDGPKERWLCTNCEQKFGMFEKKFADSLFHPLVKGNLKDALYGPWLLQFCVSLSWRALRWVRSRDSFDDYSPSDRRRLEQAEMRWKEFLLDTNTPLNEFRQHLLLVRRVSAYSDGFPPQLNVYFRRTIEVDVLRVKKHVVVYVHFPCFVFMGVVRDDDPQSWISTEVQKTGGAFPVYQQIPHCFNEYFAYKIRKAHDASQSMNEKQKQKINDFVEANPTKVADSETQRAKDDDAAMYTIRP